MRKLIFTVFLFSSVARGAVPSQFSVQGVLRDSSGKLQSMMVNVTVSLWDAQTSGNKLAGPYGPAMVMATNGLFTFPINDAALTTELGAAPQVWLELSVGNDTFARQAVTPEIYALLCGTADDLSGVLSIAHGGTGSATQNFVDLTTDQTLGGNKTFTSDKPVRMYGPSQNAAELVDGGTMGASVLLQSSNNGGDSGGALLFGAGGTNYFAAIKGMARNLNLNTVGDINIQTRNSIGDAKLTSRLYVTYDGNVGIGTTSPQATLHVVGAAEATPTDGYDQTNTTTGNVIRVGATTNRVDDGGVILFETAGSIGAFIKSAARSGAISNLYLGTNKGASVMTPDITIDTLGRVGIGTTTPGYKLEVLGDINASGLVRSSGSALTSDARLKSNVHTIENALDSVERLRGVQFTWKKDGSPSIGVIAQEVEKVYPELVSTAPDGIKAVDYPKLIGVPIESTKELRRKNAALQARIERLEAR